MRKLIILVAVTACCLAAPSPIKQERPNEIALERPSPINPEVPMEPKPEEKITMITDPKEIAQHMQEKTNAQMPHEDPQHVSPTVTPVSSSSDAPHGVIHHRQKRDEKPRDSTKVQPLKIVEKPVSTTAKPTTTAETTPKRTYRPRTTVIPKKSEPTREPAKHQRRRSAPHEETPSTTTPVSVPKPLIHRDQHHVPLQVPQTSPVHLSSTGNDNKEHQFSRPQTLSAFQPNGQATTVDEVKPQTLPALNHAIQAQTHAEHVDAKRDIPVPLVPKYHHPEESPKDDEKKPENAHEQEQKQPSKDVEHAMKREDVQVEDLSDTVPHQQTHHSEPVQKPQHMGSQSQEHVVHPSQEYGVHHSQEHANLEQQHDVVQHLPHVHHQYQSQEHHFQPQHPHMAAQHVEIPAMTASTTTTSTSTEHPVLRPKPVPVAELFGRPHDHQ